MNDFEFNGIKDSCAYFSPLNADNYYKLIKFNLDSTISVKKNSNGLYYFVEHGDSVFLYDKDSGANYISYAHFHRHNKRFIITELINKRIEDVLPVQQIESIGSLGKVNKISFGFGFLSNGITLIIDNSKIKSITVIELPE
jgi:hypothetical protein